MSTQVNNVLYRLAKSKFSMSISDIPLIYDKIKKR